ncbi:MAG: hypothetical protein ACXVP0_13270 [Bacteroidia bacterium]
MRRIIAVAWFNHGGHTFGIVITLNSIDEGKAWIGVVAGVDPTKDMINIAQYGSNFPLNAAIMIMKEKGEYLSLPLEVTP